MDTVQDGYCLFDTAIGDCAIAWNANGITQMQFPEKNRALTEQAIVKRSSAQEHTPPQPVVEAIALVRRYLDGERVDFSAVDVDLPNASGFHRKLYAELRKIGWGKTITYGALGKNIGEMDPRDIGQAMGKNPVPIIIPCHRVLAAGNKIGGFSAPGGISTKEKLLTLEGIAIGVPDDEPIFPGLLAPQRRAAN
jgi:methylated-DNA-[protein]-cysteine S-methyltransferase